MEQCSTERCTRLELQVEDDQHRRLTNRDEPFDNESYEHMQVGFARERVIPGDAEVMRVRCRVPPGHERADTVWWMDQQSKMLTRLLSRIDSTFKQAGYSTEYASDDPGTWARTFSKPGRWVSVQFAYRMEIDGIDYRLVSVQPAAWLKIGPSEMARALREHGRVVLPQHGDVGVQGTLGFVDWLQGRSMGGPGDQLAAYAGFTPVVDDVVEVMKANPTWTVRVEAFLSPDTGVKADRAAVLSSMEAAEFLDRLVAKGVDPSRLTYVGRGIDNPVVAPASVDAEFRNHRVEIVLTTSTK